MNQKTIKLNDGTIVPLIGLGTHKLLNPEVTVYEAIKAGVRLIDTGTRYRNEKEVGKGIKRALDEGIVKREELIIIGKVWLDMRAGDYDPENKYFREPKTTLKNTLEKFI